MGAPGHKLDLQQGQPSADSQRFIPGDDLLRAARRRVDDAHNAALGVLQKVVAQQGGGRVRAAKRHAEVALFNIARLNGGSQKRLRRTVLRQQHQPACTGVQPVAEVQVSGALRVGAALSCANQRPAVCASRRAGIPSREAVVLPADSGRYAEVKALGRADTEFVPTV